MHISVLLQEVLKTLEPKSGEFFVDGTAGGGGHLREIIKRLEPGGMVAALDRSSEAVTALQAALEKDPPNLTKTLVVADSYAKLAELLKRESLPKADGILLDLGMSSDQIQEGAGRGFSFRFDEPLLMTYDEADIPLYQRLAQLSEKELTRIIRDYSDERYAERIAKSICRSGPMTRTSELVKAVEAAVPAGYEQGRIHPATRTFMALRIWINDELAHLENFLNQIEEVLAEGGRLAIISFHSAEDRLVKQRFQELVRQKNFSFIHKKPVQASLAEVDLNPRSRSAKLRGITRN
ncbi:MAG: 16S rRNA (cytosine(1402)-N(4))-methyltransferase RsmH [Candidatus Harrisonbacteria bacterium]|nr:16S rRNA (cytosine(1402)-N(4))-methyltransferase RsmH [Candidatus Harrisonbacteria bacterium]